MHVGTARCADSAVVGYVRNMNALRHQLACGALHKSTQGEFSHSEGRGLSEAFDAARAPVKRMAPLPGLTHLTLTLRDPSSFESTLARVEAGAAWTLSNEAQAPTADMAETPPSIRKSAPTTYVESSDAR